MAISKRNILLSDVTESMKFKGRGYGSKKKYPERDVNSHARSISDQYKRVYTEKQVAAIKTKGTYIEFSGKQSYELATKSLENRTHGIQLLNIHDGKESIRATVYIPEGKEEVFSKKIDQYANEKTKGGNPRNNDLIRSIDAIELATPESFWTDHTNPLPQKDPVGCEVWLRYDENRKKPDEKEKVEKEFCDICFERSIWVNRDHRIVFPERIVKLVVANYDQLKCLIEECEYISELRKAEQPVSFFENLSRDEQKQWGKDLLDRCTYKDSNVTICILDSGMNENHPLLAPAVQDHGIHTYNRSWGTEDNVDRFGNGGHGTEMAGLAVFGDLQSALESKDDIEIGHKIESVKILPKAGNNPQELYGLITQEAVNIAEIDNPEKRRVICMAVTAHNKGDGRPTSWSASLDSITSGSTEEENPHRLFLVSAGNTDINRFSDVKYPDWNGMDPVQDPAQSWNAITVGAYANKVEIDDKRYIGYTPLARYNELSPYSTTSVLWNKWPVKPEVLFGGGNAATNGDDYNSDCPDLSLLTTGHKPLINLFSTINATSAATAQAANFCAKLMTEYPELWPESIRALMISSASWTDEMHQQFCPKDSRTKKIERRNLLRNCGYGIPDLNKAIQCLNNAVNMIVQGELQPYRRDGSEARMNEMHIHKFPWPEDLLRELGEQEVKLKVTLSYFIEPYAGDVGWRDRYCYASCGLRFEINHTGQTEAEFRNKISKLAEEEERGSVKETSSPNNWYLGMNNRSFGSIHSDFIKTRAVELCDTNMIAVYPVGGWWKEKVHLGKSENKVRYSLVISLSTPEAMTDLYTPIIQKIAPQIEVSI